MFLGRARIEVVTRSQLILVNIRCSLYLRISLVATVVSLKPLLFYHIH